MGRPTSPANPLVSVVLAAHNSARYIERTLRSVLQQTYENIEVLVVNDGSTDRTAEIVAGAAQSDSRVRILHQQNQGVAAARNRGIQDAQGSFIASIDSDDLWHPQNLAEQVACFQRSDALLGLVYSWSFDIDENDRPLGAFSAAAIDGFVYKTLLCHYFIGNASASLIRRSCLDAVGGYDCSLKAQGAQGCEDVDLALRIAEGHRFCHVPRFLVAYRKHASSMSADFDRMGRSHDIVIGKVRERHPEVPPLLIRMARSSMALYLAKQAVRNRDRAHTNRWLKRAFTADPLSSLLRPDFYRALLFQPPAPKAVPPLRPGMEPEVPQFRGRTLAVRSKVLAASAVSRLIQLRLGMRNGQLFESR